MDTSSFRGCLLAVKWLSFDGTTVDLNVSDGGGQCGVWVEEDGSEVLEMLERL